LDYSARNSPLEFFICFDHELIKMLMDQDMRQSPEGFKQTRDVDKIGGFQELTNRLQFNLNERYLVLY
jgi:hypothetical protein